MACRSNISCNILSYWSAFSYTIFSIIDHVLNRSFQYERIYVTYLFPYRFTVTEKFECGRALNSIPLCSPGIYYNIHAGKDR